MKAQEMIFSDNDCNQVFIPMTDELMYEHPENIKGPLVPYMASVDCQQWLTIEINPVEN